MNRLSINVTEIQQVLLQFDVVLVYRAPAKGGPYTHLTVPPGGIELNVGTTVYEFVDEDGTDDHWYKTSYYNTTTSAESPRSEPIRGGTAGTRVGYTFRNYAPEFGEWGEVLTADDIRYTYMFGIDAVAQNAAADEFTDEQFSFFVDEAVGDFENYLKIDIRRRKYKTRPDPADVRSPVWRTGVDYTDLEDPYDFDPRLWEQYGFLQLRHYPVINVHRAALLTVVGGEIMDLIARGWLRVHRKYGQLNFFPMTGTASFGPFGVHGNIWRAGMNQPYPGGFIIDYETGYETSDFVPRGLRNVIGMWATVKALDTIGDGLLAGFSSQSVSLDGLSESFSSTQSATSAYFGARIKSYIDQIDTWLQRNRHQYSIPLGFVGGG